MNTADISNGPVFDAGYMPYFYSSGRFLAYDLNSRAADSRKFGTASGYNFSNDIVPNSRIVRTETVEDIVNRGYFAAPKSEPETAIITDKKHTSGLSLNGMISQIRKRYDIYQQNMDQIECNKCYAINSQLEVESARGGVRTSSKEAYSLTKNLGEFYREQCDERRSLWADISKLKILLPEHAQSYLTSYRKLSILNDTEGDQLE